MLPPTHYNLQTTNLLPPLDTLLQLLSKLDIINLLSLNVSTTLRMLFLHNFVTGDDQWDDDEAGKDDEDEDDDKDDDSSDEEDADSEW